MPWNGLACSKRIVGGRTPAGLEARLGGLGGVDGRLARSAAGDRGPVVSGVDDAGGGVGDQGNRKAVGRGWRAFWRRVVAGPRRGCGGQWHEGGWVRWSTCAGINGGDEWFWCEAGFRGRRGGARGTVYLGVAGAGNVFGGVQREKLVISWATRGDRDFGVGRSFTRGEVWFRTKLEGERDVGQQAHGTFGRGGLTMHDAMLRFNGVERELVIDHRKGFVRVTFSRGAGNG